MARRMSAAVSEAEQVEEPAELLARAAAVDVAKNSGVVCTRVPHENGPGRKTQKVWTVPAWTSPSWLEALIPARV